MIISCSSDWLYPSFQSLKIVESLIDNSKKVSYCNVESNAGHDAFLLQQDVGEFGQITQSFLMLFSMKKIKQLQKTKI